MIHRQWIKEIREVSPRVHCITNYVTAGDVANMVLAIGGSPIMAQGIREVEDVTSICGSLVLNMGTLEEERVEAMLLAGKKAGSLHHPVILDPVGVTASGFRRNAAQRILREVRPTVIRGNASEILVLEQAFSGRETGNVCGVDANDGDGKADGREAAISLADHTGAVVAVTGTTDFVAAPGYLASVYNGHPWMARITGSGCMLDGIMGVFCALEGASIAEAATAALCAHGLCGELAAAKVMKMGGGTGSFRMYLMDYMSMLDDEMLERGKKIEI